MRPVSGRLWGRRPRRRDLRAWVAAGGAGLSGAAAGPTASYLFLGTALGGALTCLQCFLLLRPLPSRAGAARYHQRVWKYAEGGVSFLLA